ncbi:hypothetical protein F5Y18DRAFT_398812 [Xylariaceae sp. FL1019]|nr:hypothetical protein F5Y18DRAFT_398812 [Xylariaceae sp. FL1019]
MDLEVRLKKPVVFSPTGKEDNLVGNIRMDIRDEARVCASIADSYDPQLGARSIFRGVEEKIEVPIVERYTGREEEEEIVDGQDETKVRVGMDAANAVQVWMV